MLLSMRLRRILRAARLELAQRLKEIRELWIQVFARGLRWR